MSSWIIALLVGLAAGAWTWNKSMKSTNRHDTSLIIGAVVGIIIFIVLWSLTNLIFG